MNQSFFGMGESDAAPSLQSEAKDSEAMMSSQSSLSNATVHNGPFMDDSLRALRRGLLAQMDVQHDAQLPGGEGSSRGGSDDQESTARGGDFSLMLDMGFASVGGKGNEGTESAEEAEAKGEAAGASASRPVMFVSHAPLVFACLRHSLNIPDSEYRAAFQDEGFQALKPATSKSGRSFYMTQDDRFILKSLSRAEADFLLEVLCHYYEHVAKHPSTLLPRFCGLYEVSEKGRDVMICIEANAFSSQCPIDERYDLKGSVVGRLTREEDKVKDSNVTLKDLDLKRQLALGVTCRSLLLMQLKADCQFLENLEIVDYSLLLGVHNPQRHNEEVAHAGDEDQGGVGGAEAGGPAARGGRDEERASAAWHARIDHTASPQDPQGQDVRPDDWDDSQVSRHSQAACEGSGSFGVEIGASEQQGRGRREGPGQPTGTWPRSAGLQAQVVDTLDDCHWRFVKMLSSQDFDAKITFNPNRVLVVLVAAGSDVSLTCVIRVPDMYGASLSRLFYVFVTRVACISVCGRGQSLRRLVPQSGHLSGARLV